MRIYLNRPAPSTGVKANSISLVSQKLTRQFESLGASCTYEKKSAWDVCLAFMYERDADVYKRGPVVQRLDGIYLDSDTNYKSSNSSLLDSYRRVSGVIFQSKFSQKVVTKNFGETVQPHVVIPNGTEIDDKTDSQEYLRTNYPQLREAFEKYPKRIVCAAEWRPSKRLSSIIVGSEAYLCNNPDACLFVLGDLEKTYTSKIKSRTPNIYFLGKINNQDVRHFYRIAGVCVNLCIMDACPNSVIEAMAHGTPCLVTKHQGVVELMRPESGVVLDVDPWDYGPISFTTACAKIKPEIVAAGIDRCMKLGRTGYRYDLSATDMGKRYFEFLQMIARKK